MFLTPYNYTASHSEACATQNDEPSLTQQSDANDCDINVIMARYQQTGQVPQIVQQAIYGDFTTVTDFRSALDMVRNAQEKFAELPAKIRAKFNNNPAEFMDFVHDPNNADAMVEMGLAEPPPKPQNQTPQTIVEEMVSTGIANDGSVTPPKAAPNAPTPNNGSTTKPPR